MKWKVGDATITKVTEIVYPEFSDVIPAATPDVVKKVQWLFPHFVTPEGLLSLSIHSLIVDMPGAKLVVDTCIGNDRDRAPMDVMSNLSTSFLDDMKAAGYAPESIDYVLCTHLHLDHVGWNTRMENGKWVPTFPKASYLMDQKELDLFGDIDPNVEEDFMQVQRRVYEDSVKPVMDAGLAKPVSGPSPVCEGVRLIATPGHTPGHSRIISSPLQGDFCCLSKFWSFFP